jgi:hypothetical protein
VRGRAPRCLGGAGRGTGVVCDVSPNPVPDIQSTGYPAVDICQSEAGVSAVKKGEGYLSCELMQERNEKCARDESRQSNVFGVFVWIGTEFWVVGVWRSIVALDAVEMTSK